MKLILKNYKKYKINFKKFNKQNKNRKNSISYKKNYINKDN